jgi:hypothetical protein
MYLDDILIYLETLEQHVGYIIKVLKALQARRLLVKIKKCKFHKQSVKFLNYLIMTNRIQMDKTKVKTILNWPILTSVKEL